MAADVVSRNPFTGAVVFRAPAAGPAEVADALSRASAAAPGWALAPVQRRADALRAFADAVEAQAGVLAEVIVAEWASGASTPTGRSPGRRSPPAGTPDHLHRARSPGPRAWCACRWA